MWAEHFPATDDEMAAAGLAYYRGGDPAKPVVYEDFLPARPPASSGPTWTDDADGRREADRRFRSTTPSGWPAQIGHHIHDPYELYEKVACS